MERLAKARRHERLKKLRRFTASPLSEELYVNANLRFEIIADAFHTMTGHMAPGKNVSAAAYAGQEHEEARGAAWFDWLTKNKDVINALMLGVERNIPDV